MRVKGRGVLHSVLTVIVLAGLMTTGCEYGRMYDQDTVKTYKRKMPAMDKRSVPLSGGYEVLSHSTPGTMANPLADSPLSIERGRLAYGYFCAQCHGPRLDGLGTVGQSFAPLPANLASPGVLSLKDGEIYSKVRLGFKRHPALYTTISEEDTWAVILFMRRTARGAS